MKVEGWRRRNDGEGRDKARAQARSEKTRAKQGRKTTKQSSGLREVSFGMHSPMQTGLRNESLMVEDGAAISPVVSAQVHGPTLVDSMQKVVVERERGTKETHDEVKKRISDSFSPGKGYDGGQGGKEDMMAVTPGKRPTPLVGVAPGSPPMPQITNVYLEEIDGEKVPVARVSAGAIVMKAQLQNGGKSWADIDRTAAEMRKAILELKQTVEYTGGKFKVTEKELDRALRKMKGIVIRRCRRWYMSRNGPLRVIKGVGPKVLNMDEWAIPKDKCVTPQGKTPPCLRVVEQYRVTASPNDSDEDYHWLFQQGGGEFEMEGQQVALEEATMKEKLMVELERQAEYSEGEYGIYPFNDPTEDCKADPLADWAKIEEGGQCSKPINNGYFYRWLTCGMGLFARLAMGQVVVEIPIRKSPSGAFLEMSRQLARLPKEASFQWRDA